MKILFSRGLVGVGLALVSACGSETSSKDSSHAGAGGAGLVVDVPEAGSAGDGGSGGDAGAQGAATSREELKPVLLYIADAGKALYSWDLSKAAPANISGPANADHAVTEYAIAPDGLRVAFVNTSIKEKAGEVYVVNADGSHLTRVGGAAMADIHPSGVSWSEGGKYLLYYTEGGDKPGDPSIQYVFEAATGKPVAIHGSLSPDETHVVVFEQGTIAGQAIDGSDRVELAKSKDEPALSWSADGQMLSMWTTDDGQSVLSANGKGLWRFNNCSRAAAWAPKGHWLACPDSGKLLVQAPGARELAINASGTNVSTWHWAPDGSRIAVAAGGLQVYALETGKPTRVNDSLMAEAGVGEFSWSPDGQYIAYNIVGATNDDGELFVAHPNGTENVAISDHPAGSIWSLKWSPNSAYVAYQESPSDGSWFVASLLGENTFAGNGVDGVWSDDGEFFAVEPGEMNPSIRVLRLSDKKIIGPGGPDDGQNFKFGLAPK